MSCPLCHHDEDHVIRSKERNDTVHRVRQCDRCGHRWQTVELPVADVERIRRIEAAWGSLADSIGGA
jgi:transcriptional regulator NrdR family protein